MSNCFIGEEKINKLVDAFHSKGYEIYAVGGCVRDLLMHKHPKDIDFCTNASIVNMYGVMKTLVQDMGEKCYIIPTGEQYGTLTFHFDSEAQFEVTCYRKDGAYHDGRHPDEVVFTTNIEEDLARRDFTCNAIAMNWETRELIDPFGGENDIKQGIIRCVGNPEERFNEDALRIIRLVRFALKYNFEIDMNTYIFAKKLIDNIQYVSKERIGAEFVKILSYKYVDCFKTSKNYKTYDLLVSLLRKIFPNCQRDEVVQNIVLGHKVPLLRWYSACIGENEQDTAAFINQFAVGSDICNGVKNLNKAFKFLKNSNIYWKDKKVLDIVRTPDERKALISKLIDDSRDVEDIVQAIVNDEPYGIEQLAIDGNWVMNYLNMKPGPQVKKVLEDILDFVCQYPDSNTEEDIKEFLGENYKAEEV